MKKSVKTVEAVIEGRALGTTEADVSLKSIISLTAMMEMARVALHGSLEEMVGAVCLLLAAYSIGAEDMPREPKELEELLVELVPVVTRAVAQQMVVREAEVGRVQ